jgi:perosamine synthetase
MKIPQYDLDGLGGEFKVTEELEKSIARYFKVKHCVMVSSGTAAIFLALRATGAKKVAVPLLTMIATATAAELAGCEISFTSNNEIPKDIDTYVHVSLNGRDCGIEEVIKANPGITIIEDACQSFGSQHKGKFLGTFGKAGCFSFSPHKIISAGNGGCVVTNDDEVARNVKKLKNFGRESGGSDHHDSIGYNFKFTDIQAQYMLKQFLGIEKRLEKKKKIYEKYYKKLSDIMLPHTGVPWFFDIYVNERERMAKYLNENGIGTRNMYPLLSQQPPFSKTEVFGDTKIDTARSSNGLWLPSSLSLKDDEINFIIKTITSWK